MPAYWYSDQANFGDAMAPRLIQLADSNRSFHLVPGSRRGKLMTIGSNHHWIRPFDTVAGAGSMLPLKFRAAQSVHFVSLRGPLTWDLLGRPKVISLGDPGLLARKLIEDHPTISSKFQRDAGGFIVVPHVSEVDYFQSVFPDLNVVDPRDDPLEVLSRIQSAEFVFSSSLHGIVVADSFEIPSVWLQRTVKPAGTHKFIDYFLGVGRPKGLRPHSFLKGPAKLRRHKLPTASFSESDIIDSLAIAVRHHRSRESPN